MKYIVAFILGTSLIIACRQKQAHTDDTETAITQNHVLPELQGWNTELIPFPIDFAPGIPFAGTEELRFAPGWGDTTSVEHWSYCFLWYVNADASLDAASLKSYLEEYYNGLVKRNIEPRNIPASVVIPTVAHVAETNDPEKPYAVTIEMLDYHRQKPMTLNVDVAVKLCKGNGKKGIFLSVSPQPHTHPIWNDFKGIWDGFQCGK